MKNRIPRLRQRIGRALGRGSAREAESILPSPVALDMGQSFQEYYYRRVIQSTQEWYAGVRLAKFPEDLRTYEHILWEMAADTVIEVGAAFGGSALWFRDRLKNMEHYGRIERSQVISLDVDVERPRQLLDEADPAWSENITLIAGDVSRPGLDLEVGHLLWSGARCFVIEDSAHVYETTRGALETFARFVPKDGYMVVEDGYVDIPEMVPGPQWNWVCPEGVLPAVRDWLGTREGKRFEVRREMELYGNTSNPEGILQRVR